MANVSIMDKGARESMITFEKGAGDAAMSCGSILSVSVPDFPPQPAAAGAGIVWGVITHRSIQARAAISAASTWRFVRPR